MKLAAELAVALAVTNEVLACAEARVARQSEAIASLEALVAEQGAEMDRLLAQHDALIAEEASVRADTAKIRAETKAIRHVIALNIPDAEA